MPSQPLTPFATPAQVFSHLPLGALPAGGVAIEGFLYAVFAFWALYTLVIVYHWLAYSHASLVALPAIALHLAVSLAIGAYALSGARLFI